MAMNHDSYPDSYIRAILKSVKTVALVGTALGVKRLPSGGILKALGVVLVIAGLKLILT